MQTEQPTEQQPSTLGTLLAQLKQKKGIRQADLCKAARISPLTWYRIIKEEAPNVIKKGTARQKKEN